MPLSHAELQRILHYDPETGYWRWLVRLSPRAKIGVPLKATLGRGYVPIVIYKHPYQGHILAWFYMTGEWPKHMIDHKNNDPSDNRWKNLRPTNKSLNGANAKMNRRNTTGLKGVQKGSKNRWQARLGCLPNRLYLGCFSCPAAAHFAYLIAADIRYGEHARAR